MPAPNANVIFIVNRDVSKKLERERLRLLS